MSIIKELSDSINLSKKYPGYFNKKVFWAVIIFVALLDVWAIYDNDLLSGPQPYFECPKDSVTYCKNPFYSGNFRFGSEEQICSKIDCTQEYVSPGSSMGKKPSIWYTWRFELTFMIVALGFSLNHYLYRRKWRESLRRTT